MGAAVPLPRARWGAVADDAVGESRVLRPDDACVRAGGRSRAHAHPELPTWFTSPDAQHAHRRYWRELKGTELTF